MLCDYGCGNEAIKYFERAKKWCCSEFVSQCPETKKKNSAGNKGHKGWNTGITKETNMVLKEISEKLKGRTVWNKGLKVCFSEESLIKIRKKRKLQIITKGKFDKENIPWNKGLTKENNKILAENGHKISLKNLGRLQSEDEKNKRRKPIHDDKFKENQRRRCLNGHALVMIKAIKKISKPEIKLRDMVKVLYPECEFQYGVFNYALDAAIVEHKIAIEFDGYYHFDTPEHIEYHTYRRNRIIGEGWVFYRVTMFDKFPELETLKKDILKLINTQSKLEQKIKEEK